jgi:hypothetical protein
LTSDQYFFEKVWIDGNWDNSRCIYNCETLSSKTTPTNCPGFVPSDNRIVVSDKPRWVEIKQVRLIPNNAMPNYNQDLYIKF